MLLHVNESKKYMMEKEEMLIVYEQYDNPIQARSSIEEILNSESRRTSSTMSWISSGSTSSADAGRWMDRIRNTG